MQRERGKMKSFSPPRSWRDAKSPLSFFASLRGLCGSSVFLLLLFSLVTYAQSACLTITGTEGALVFVGGVEVGEIPIENLVVTPGVNEITVVKEGHKAFREAHFIPPWGPCLNLEVEVGGAPKVLKYNVFHFALPEYRLPAWSSDTQQRESWVSVGGVWEQLSWGRKSLHKDERWSFFVGRATPDTLLRYDTFDADGVQTSTVRNLDISRVSIGVSYSQPVSTFKRMTLLAEAGLLGWMVVHIRLGYIRERFFPAFGTGHRDGIVQSDATLGTFTGVPDF